MLLHLPVYSSGAKSENRRSTGNVNGPMDLLASCSGRFVIALVVEVVETICLEPASKQAVETDQKAFAFFFAATACCKNMPATSLAMSPAINATTPTRACGGSVEAHNLAFAIASDAVIRGKRSAVILVMGTPAASTDLKPWVE